MHRRRGQSSTEAVEPLAASAAAEGLAFCHPFDDPAVIAGQGTLGLELLDDIADLALVIVPLGGGGLAAGVAIAVKSIAPGRPRRRRAGRGVRALRRRPAADRAGRHARRRHRRQVAAARSLVRWSTRWIDEIVTVDEDTIADAMVLLMERAKLYVEGAGAVGVAALISGARRACAPTGTTCVVLSGGNVDLGVVPGLIRRHETQAGRRLTVFARIDDRPGGLARLLDGVRRHRRQPARGRSTSARCSTSTSARPGCRPRSRCAAREHADAGGRRGPRPGSRTSRSDRLDVDVDVTHLPTGR